MRPPASPSCRLYKLEAIGSCAPEGNAENKKGNAELKGINGQQHCERDSQGGIQELKGVPMVTKTFSELTTTCIYNKF
jgi:hypothetical protein